MRAQLRGVLYDRVRVPQASASARLPLRDHYTFTFLLTIAGVVRDEKRRRRNVAVSFPHRLI